MPEAGGRPGRCAASFWLALAFDAAGLSALLSGAFSSDAAFSDLLVYGGVVVVALLLGLLWWAFWYAANLEEEAPPPAELRDGHEASAAKEGRRRGMRGRLRACSLRLSAAFCRRASGRRVVTIRSATSVELEPV